MQAEPLHSIAAGRVVLNSIRLGYNNDSTPVFEGVRVGGPSSTTFTFTNVTNSDHKITVDINDVSIVFESGPNQPPILYIP